MEHKLRDLTCKTSKGLLNVKNNIKNSISDECACDNTIYNILTSKKSSNHSTIVLLRLNLT